MGGLKFFSKKPIKISEAFSKQLQTAVIGTGKGVGATHMAMMTANVLAYGFGLKTAVAEYNEQNDYIKIWKEVRGEAKSSQCFCWNNIDFYRNVTPQKYTGILLGDYEAVVSDMRYDAQDCMQDFYRSSRRIVVAGMSQWQIADTKKLLEREALASKRCIWTAFNYDKTTADVIKKRYGITVYQIPFESNPFKISADSFYKLIQFLKI